MSSEITFSDAGIALSDATEGAIHARCYKKHIRFISNYSIGIYEFLQQFLVRERIVLLTDFVQCWD